MKTFIQEDRISGNLENVHIGNDDKVRETKVKIKTLEKNEAYP